MASTYMKIYVNNYKASFENHWQTIFNLSVKRYKNSS